MSLSLDSAGNYIGVRDSLNLSFNEINLPDDMNVYIHDNYLGFEQPISNMQEIPIITDSIGIIDFDLNSPINQYLDYGEYRYFISFQYSMLSNNSNQLIPESYQLFQNYPNPFNPNTKIVYNIPEEQFVKIIIYNMLGHKVKTLVNKMQSAGLKTVNWNGLDDNNKQLPSGFYLCSLKSGTFRESKKMVLLK